MEAFSKEKTMDANLDRIARRRAGAKLGFYVHAGVFALVNLALYAVSERYTPSLMWNVWPLMGWGIGLAFHSLAVFFLGSGSSLRQRMVAHERRLLEAETRAR
jgi:hypothetical protein